MDCFKPPSLFAERSVGAFVEASGLTRDLLTPYWWAATDRETLGNSSGNAVETSRLEGLALFSRLWLR
jgi:hypothetical protein